MRVKKINPNNNDSILEYYNFCASTASMLRVISRESKKYFYHIESWQNTLRHICLDLGASHAVMRFVYPRFKFQEEEIFVSVEDNNLNVFNELTKAISYKNIEKRKIFNRLKKNNKFCDPTGKEIFKIFNFFYDGYIKCELFIFFPIYKDYSHRYTHYLLNHSFIAIENLLQHELTPFLGKDRLKRSKKEVDLDYLFRPDKKAIIMFIDIRNFTPLCEFLRNEGGKCIQRYQKTTSKYPYIEEILFKYCEEMSKIIFRFGRVDKFLGDGIMAIFGDMLGVDEKHWHIEALKAVCTAHRIQYAFKELRDEWNKNWLSYHQRTRPEEIAPEVGIGVHSGPASFGFFGTEEHREFSAIGDTVNFAQRIESIAAKEGRENILISQPIYFSILEANQNARASIYEESKMKKYKFQFKGKNFEYPIWGISSIPNEICSAYMNDKGCETCWHYPQKKN